MELKEGSLAKINEIVGRNIKEYRLKKGYTQEYLAEKVGVSIQTISFWERGYKSPKLTNLFLAAEALDCKVTDLDERCSQNGVSFNLNLNIHYSNYVYNCYN